jgi:hypothetical protein
VHLAPRLDVRRVRRAFSPFEPAGEREIDNRKGIAHKHR